MKLIIFTLILLAIPVQANNAEENVEFLNCAVLEVVAGAPVAITINQIFENKSYGVIVKKTFRVLVDFTAEADYKSYFFTAIFDHKDAKQDIIILQLLRIEGEEIILCDEYYLQLVYPNGIPLAFIIPFLMGAISLLFVLTFVSIVYHYMKKRRQTRI